MMQQSTQYSSLRIVSTLGGIVLLGVAAFLNASHAVETEGSYLSPVVLGIVALVFGSALAVPVMITLSRSGHKGLAAVAFAGLVAGELFGLQLSAERLLAARDLRAHGVKSTNVPRDLAREAYERSIVDRKAECQSGEGKKCQSLRATEAAQLAKLATFQAPRSHSLLADATGWPSWLVEIVPALAFSSSLMIIGFVLIGFGTHGQHGSPATVERSAEAAPEPPLNEHERVVSWVRAFERRHGRKPQIPEVQQAFTDLSKTTAWRRIQSS